MAYSDIYIFRWQSTNGVDWEIHLQSSSGGSVQYRNLGKAPVLKKKHNGRIYGTSLEFFAECTVDREFTSLYTSDPQQYRVQLKRKVGNTFVYWWQGFVSPELYSEPAIAPPYDVDIIATDGLGELKQYTFEACGPQSLGEIFRLLLSYTGQTGFTTLYAASLDIVSQLTGTAENGDQLDAEDMFGIAEINIDYMAGKTCYEVLQYLLETLQACITYHNGGWLIYRENDLQIDMTGQIDLIDGRYKVGMDMYVGSMDDYDVWPIGNLTTIAVPALNEVSVVAPMHKWTPILNPEMSSDRDWTKGSDTLYDVIKRAYHFPASAFPQGGIYTTGDPRGPHEEWIKSDAPIIVEQTVHNVDLSEGGNFVLSLESEGLAEDDGAIVVYFYPDDSEQCFSLLHGFQLHWYPKQKTVALNYYMEDQRVTYGGLGEPAENTIEIPAFSWTGYETTGSLKIMIFPAGGCYVRSCYLYRPITKGFRDVANIGNGARGSDQEIEIAVGRMTSAMQQFAGYLRGVLVVNDDGDRYLVTLFADRIVNGVDFLKLTTLNRALSVAGVRVRTTGTLNTPAELAAMPFAINTADGTSIIETFSWDMLNDELQVDALTVPSSQISFSPVETVTDISGTGYAGVEASGGGGGASGVPGGTSTAEIYALNERVVAIESIIGEDEDHDAIVKPWIEYVEPEPEEGEEPEEDPEPVPVAHTRGLKDFRDLTFATDEVDPLPHLEIVKVVTGTAPNPTIKYYLHSRLAIVSDDDIVAGGRDQSSGGGGTNVVWGETSNGYRELIVGEYAAQQVAIPGHGHTVAEVFAGIGSSTPQQGQTVVWNGSSWGYGTAGGTQVQADWAQTDSSAVDFIKNKPDLATVATSGSYDDLSDKPNIPAAQIQSDWGQTNSSAVNFIKNKPTIPTHLGDLSETTTGTGSYHLTKSYKDLLNALAHFDDMFERVGSGTSADPYLIHAFYPLYSDGDIIAGGIGSGGGGGGGGAEYINQLEDVTIVNPTSRQALLYNSSTQIWENQTLQISDINGLSAAFGDYVTLDTEQAISGSKTFSSMIVASGGIKLGATGVICVPDGQATRDAIYITADYLGPGYAQKLGTSNNNWSQAHLGTTVIYAALKPNADVSIDLGTASRHWDKVFASGLYPAGATGNRLEYDPTIGGFKITGNLVATGDIVAGGTLGDDNTIEPSGSYISTIYTALAKTSGNSTSSVYIPELAAKVTNIAAGEKFLFKLGSQYWMEITGCFMAANYCDIFMGRYWFHQDPSSADYWTIQCL
jgi:hypothetical protein